MRLALKIANLQYRINENVTLEKISTVLFSRIKKKKSKIGKLLHQILIHAKVPLENLNPRT